MEIFETALFGQPFSIRIHPEREELSNTIRERKEYHRNDLDLIQRNVRPGDLFVDAGANIGWHTLFSARLVGPRGKVIAFEPDPKNASLLRENIALNGFENVEVVEAALSDTEGDGVLYRSPTNYGDHRMDAHSIESSHAEKIQVKTCLLDDWIDAKTRRPALIKIDTQGSEPRVLSGMRRLLKTYRPPILIEYAPLHIYSCGLSPFEIFSFIERHGYRPSCLKSNGSGDDNEILREVTIESLFAFTRYAKDSGHWMDLFLVAPRA